VRKKKLVEREEEEEAQGTKIEVGDRMHET
jgi:hypothetical protein